MVSQSGLSTPKFLAAVSVNTPVGSKGTGTHLGSPASETGIMRTPMAEVTVPHGPVTLQV